jgi:hypothetical protein
MNLASLVPLADATDKLKNIQALPIFIAAEENWIVS